MDNYYICNNSYQNINYRSIGVSSNTLSIASSHQIDVMFTLTEPLDILQTNIGKKKVTSSNLELLNVICEIKCIKQNGEEKILILRPLTDAKLSVSGNTVFSISIEPKDIEKFIAWIKGGSISINWKISGYVLVLDSLDPLPPILLYRSNWTEDIKPIISSQFISDITRILNLNSIFTDEFPLEMDSDITKLQNNCPSSIISLIGDLKLLIIYLNEAVIKLRNANQSIDYIEIMNNVKSSLDTIRKPSNTKDLGFELLIKTSVISKFDSSGGEDEAAEEFFTCFFSILENIYQIASKPAHKSTKRTKRKFSMSPDRPEAIMVTEMGLAVSKYLLTRISHYIKTI